MAKKEKIQSNKIVDLNIKEAKIFLNHIIKNNRFLQSQNKPPVSVEVSGDSGIGKTSMVVQITEEEQLHFVKLNLAQIEELGDLVGFPIRQFEMELNEHVLWVDEHSIDHYRTIGYRPTSKNRTSYCPPEWIAGKESGGLLLLDDWNRADNRFIQAVMELVDRQQYVSWKLPKDWHIILTSNPDNGEYMVNSIDTAQKTRFISVNLQFDIECWGKWAEENSVDSRCINFLLLHPELVNTSVNARSITTFFNSISSITNFDNSLPLINIIGEGSVGPEFSNMFVSFINNKLDKLPNPKNVMFGDFAEVKEDLLRVIGKEDKYRADIASVLSTRISNYCCLLEKVDKPILDRISDLITNDIFNEDMRFFIMKTLYNENKFKTLALQPKITKYII